MDKTFCNSDVIMQIFRLILKMIIMIMDSLKKANKESSIVLNMKNHEFL